MSLKAMVASTVSAGVVPGSEFGLVAAVAVAVLVMVHKMELPEVHMPKVDLKKVVEEIEKEEPSDAKKEKKVEKGFIDFAEQQQEEDEGAEFEEAAMELFKAHPITTQDDKAEAADAGGETPAPQEGETVEFDIDEEFARVNAKAQEKSDEVTFTIEGMDEASESQDAAEVEPETESQETTDDQEEVEEELADDDYRRHYGLDEPYDPHLDLGDYVMPETGILEDWEVANTKVTKEELVANKDRIVQTLKDYGIEITDISAIPGPTVTLYKIKPAPGVRISKIKNLEDDIALSLAALGIRIIAPIPGESNVGIEVPNAKPQIVAMKTMLESEAFEKAKEKMELPIAFGKTISNECFVTDLAKMPHLLMAGATGTGKSVGLNAVLASLLYTKHPSELKLVLVDPKKVEFSLY